MMQKIEFTEALDNIVAADKRFDRDAYLFLRDALDHTIKLRKKQRTEMSRHVSGQELLDGVRQYALREFGPMVLSVFEHWGVKSCEDFGEMVFNLIRVGVFGKNENDAPEDFKSGYNFRDAFVVPFLPPNPVVKRAAARRKTEVAKSRR